MSAEERLVPRNAGCIAIVVDHRQIDGLLFHAAWNLDAALEVEVHEDLDHVMAWMVRRVIDLDLGHAGVAYFLLPEPRGGARCEVAGHAWHREGVVQASIEGKGTRSYARIDGVIRPIEVEEGKGST